MFTLVTLNLLYQFMIHATWIPRLGWLEGIINTPSAHRVHHASNVDNLEVDYVLKPLLPERLGQTCQRVQVALAQRAQSKAPLVQLDQQRFWQVHRGTVVRCDAIASAVRDEAGKLTLLLLLLRGHPDRLGVSRLYAQLFKGM